VRQHGQIDAVLSHPGNQREHEKHGRERDVQPTPHLTERKTGGNQALDTRED
jgi:hypothetical protein